MVSTRTILGLGFSAAVLALSVGCSSSSSGGTTTTPTPDGGTPVGGDSGVTTPGDSGKPAAEAGPSTGGGDCAAICAKAEALKCANDKAGTCVTDCTDAAAKVTAACKADWDAVLACGAAATWSCGTDGTASPAGCDDKTKALGACMQPAPEDGGTD